ncbi:MAG: aminotransferase class V-fold PLP-dependent enzyme, partial [Eubacteriales bacterium]|nr:aminotransferase class V-fold PLP-dependent enzyme [Eubacteriales bacterium]
MIYLDNAATSFPKPGGMLRVMEECILDYCGNPGRSGHRMSMRTGEEIYKARKEIGKLFQIADCSRIVFTSNATE